jgi:adenylate kinase
VDRVVFFEVSRGELLRRLTGRRVCRTCASTYHVVSAPPRTPGRCDRCGGQLVQRDDDTESAVATRLDVYERQTQPLLAYYGDRGVLARVTGEGDMDRITAEIRGAVREAA